jgi:hypothetical protein
MFYNLIVEVIDPANFLRRLRSEKTCWLWCGHFCTPDGWCGQCRGRFLGGCIERCRCSQLYASGRSAHSIGWVLPIGTGDMIETRPRLAIGEHCEATWEIGYEDCKRQVVKGGSSGLFLGNRDTQKHVIRLTFWELCWITFMYYNQLCPELAPSHSRRTSAGSLYICIINGTFPSMTLDIIRACILAQSAGFSNYSRTLAKSCQWQEELDGPENWMKMMLLWGLFLFLSLLSLLYHNWCVIYIICYLRSTS